ncbi:hypothetical protein NOI24_16370 [Neorhizobium galegae]|uniref:zinc ribbon domain-containing protein n=1 Tax=Neorhizobium galegae TaxID=399 RepID=UPI002101EC04|nr:zinc ribbon domain-containing protein [Neorhizobium galegae]MCQ1772886.1 hypothetical protein [Neorhizobium galegae]MCQ1799167.1 hypothetical protein [Neorhizobium galegae]
MAIINCPECKNSVSDTALKCPACGVQLRKPKRGFFGKLFKWSFIGFNILMAIWAVAGFNAATKDYSALSGAEQAGAAIGTGIGMAMVLVLWVLGAIMLGMFVLFTRPKVA